MDTAVRGTFLHLGVSAFRTSRLCLARYRAQSLMERATAFFPKISCPRRRLIKEARRELLILIRAMKDRRARCRDWRHYPTPIRMRHSALPSLPLYMCNKLASGGVVIDHCYTAFRKRM